MIDLLPLPSDQLNSYNVAQLQFALGLSFSSADPKCEPISFLNDLSPSSASAALIPSPSDIDYDSRRMSSSATSATDTDSSSALSRPEKRPLSASDSPQPKKSRPSISVDQPVWDAGSDSDATNGSSNNIQHESASVGPAPPSQSDAKVQLPSIFTTFEDSFRPDVRRSSLPNLPASHIRHAPYPPTGVRVNYTPTTHSSLSAYQFPATPDSSVDHKPMSRPRLVSDTNFGMSYGEQSPFSAAPPLTNGTTPSSTTFSPSNFNSPLSGEYTSRTQNLSSFPDADNWAISPSGIVRPNSTPGQLSSLSIKYEDPMRHSSFSAPISQPGLLPGTGRISGQQDRRTLSNAGLKSDWSFSSPDFLLSSAHSYPSPSIAPTSIPVSNSPPRSTPAVPTSSLVDRPQRKRGKLPKETTDFLKSWLHRHSDHPYPSEEEKKQLCHATGLSMSQVSNWMINARRRILAPAHRAASGPTTTAPFPPSRIVSASALLDPTTRRASMPADTLQLYHPHPMSLQSLSGSHGHSHHHHSASDYVGSTRHLLSLSTARTSAHHHHSLSGPGGSVEFGQSRLLYVPGHGGPHSAGPTQSPSSATSMFASPTGNALSAPPSAHPFSQQGTHNSLSPQQQQNMYSGFISSPRQNSQQQLSQHDQPPQQNYYANGQSQPGSAPGSGYPTPQ